MPINATAAANGRPATSNGLSLCNSLWGFVTEVPDAFATAGVIPGVVELWGFAAAVFTWGSWLNVAGSGMWLVSVFSSAADAENAFAESTVEVVEGSGAGVVAEVFAFAVALAADAAPRARPNAPNAIKLRAVLTVSGSSFSSSANPAFARAPTSPGCSLATVR